MAARLEQDDDEIIEASINEELETLRAIYMEDVDIEFFDDLPTRPRLLTYVVEPATAQEKANRYVSFTLQLVLKENYPFSSAEIRVKNPRGLSESLVERIYARLRGQAEDGKGNPVLYELMETAKDFITDQKLPTCGCAICLCNFEERENEADDFMRTDCFHFFHIECLTHYVEFSLAEIAAALVEKQSLNPHAEPDLVVCPVCRLPLSESLLESLPLRPREEEADRSSKKSNKKNNRNNNNNNNNNRNPVQRQRLGSSGGWNSLPPDIRQKLEKERREREVTYKKQLAKGAIIDLEEEKDKYKLTFAAAADEREDEFNGGGGGGGGGVRNARASPFDSKDVTPSAAYFDVEEHHRSENERRAGGGGRHHRRRRGDDRNGQRTHKHFQEKVVFHKPTREANGMSEMRTGISETRTGMSEMKTLMSESLDHVEERDRKDEKLDEIASIGRSVDATSVPVALQPLPDVPSEPIASPLLRDALLSPPQPLLDASLSSSSSEAKSDLVIVEEAEPPNNSVNRTRGDTAYVDDERTAHSHHHPNHVVGDRPTGGRGGRGRGGGWGRGRGGDGGGWQGGRGGRGRERGGRGGRGGNHRAGSGGGGGYGKDHRNDDFAS